MSVTPKIEKVEPIPNVDGTLADEKFYPGDKELSADERFVEPVADPQFVKSAANADISTKLVAKDNLDEPLPYDTKGVVVSPSDPQFVELVEVPISKVQPGKLAAVGNYVKDMDSAKVGAIVLFEAHKVAIITGIWPNGTVNLTVFVDALPMLDIRTQVPLRIGEDFTNTWELIK